MKVQDILKTKGADVFSVSAEDTIENAVALLYEQNIGAVVVKDAAGQIGGILSERDIVREMQVRGSDVMSSKVADCMTANPITCDMQATVDDLMSMMTVRRIRHVPVVSQGQLAGVISIGDVVKRKIEASERETEALKEYIAS